MLPKTPTPFSVLTIVEFLLLSLYSLMILEKGRIVSTKPSSHTAYADTQKEKSPQVRILSMKRRKESEKRKVQFSSPDRVILIFKRYFLHHKVVLLIIGFFRASLQLNTLRGFYFVLSPY